jgi:hypothetical protein
MPMMLAALLHSQAVEVDRGFATVQNTINPGMRRMNNNQANALAVGGANNPGANNARAGAADNAGNRARRSQANQDALDVQDLNAWFGVGTRFANLLGRIPGVQLLRVPGAGQYWGMFVHASLRSAVVGMVYATLRLAGTGFIGLVWLLRGPAAWLPALGLGATTAGPVGMVVGVTLSIGWWIYWIFALLVNHRHPWFQRGRNFAFQIAGFFNPANYMPPAPPVGQGGAPAMQMRQQDAV